jgi:hypothetical protein
MSFLSDFSKSLKTTFKDLQKSQAEALAVQISANYILGKTAAEKHKSIQSAEPEDSEEDELTTEEKAELAALVALFLGYTKEFNKVAQTQILTQVKEIIKGGEKKNPEVKTIQPGTKNEIKAYLNDVFSGKTTITIDNVGKTRKEMYVDKNLQISEVTREVTRPYHTTLNGYASTIAENAAHRAYEGGRKYYYRLQGFEKWVFVGPSDERARPWHVALLGNVYTYGTAQSNHAEHCLHEPRCRHRADVFYDDDSRDKSPEEWQQLKDDAGLTWNGEKSAWELKA